jgi:FkbM family methyltransferase
VSVALEQYEAVESSLAASWLRQGDVAIDVGANVGHYTSLFSETVGESWAIEPEPRMADLLEQRITAEDRWNVTVVRAAAGNRAGRGILRICEENVGDNRTWAGDDNARQEQTEVEVVRLDDVVPVGQRVDLIKLDVQGDELTALEGATRLLGSQPRIALLLEWWPRGLLGAGSSPERLADLLYGRGFDVRYVRPEFGRAVRIDRGMLLGLIHPRTDLLANLWCVRQ